jgi:hypothetical protein
MYTDWKSVEILHEERVDHYVKSVLEDEPKFSIWQRPSFGSMFRSLVERLAGTRQRSLPRHAEKPQDARRVEWV